MIPKTLQKIHWLKSNPEIVKNILRGIERETLRINSHGEISKNTHPYSIGSALTNKWITTDFSESLLEFITPPKNNLNILLETLRDIHKFVSKNINKEYFWPFSFPPFVDSENSIILAQYGTSNLGKMKKLYRIGLKNRYGVLMNIISGVHYNFSLPITFWKLWKENNKNIQENSISDGYLYLIRNFYRFGWVISYLFGASPAIESFFIKKKPNNLHFHTKNNMLYLPWSTSLRLSSLGHTNESIKNLKLTFNSLNDYISSLEYGMCTPSKKFVKLGLVDIHGNLKQINTNILQIENELYTFIRPKRVLESNETILNSLKNKGIQYVEIRSLDINPFSCIGISQSQILFLDLFLIWCTIANSPKMTHQELQYYSKNWEIINLKGRKPKQKIYINTYNQKKTLESVGKYLMENLFYIAEVLDIKSKSTKYQEICKKMLMCFYHTDQTYSERILNQYITNNIQNTGIQLAMKNKKKLSREPLKILKEHDFINEVHRSHIMQKKMEKNDKLNSRNTHS
ncbi:MAG: glutamate--cysteine ligase [Buchnera aphidicola (Schlechtendalia peitan)]